MGCALLIDDDGPFLETVRASASVHGLHLDTADSWEEGLALFGVLAPDLVFADYDMPDSSGGLILLTEIRRLMPSVRVVLISGYLDTESAKRVEEAGLADRAIVKDGALADKLLAELRDYAAAESTQADWTAIAAAYVNADSVAEADIAEIDAMLKKRVSES